MDIHSLPWTQLSGHNVEFFLDANADFIFLRISNKPDARNAAPVSKKGRARLLASTSGFANITRDTALSLNLTIPL